MHRRRADAHLGWSRKPPVRLPTRDSRRADGCSSSIGRKFVSSSQLPRSVKRKATATVARCRVRHQELLGSVDVSMLSLTGGSERYEWTSQLLKVISGMLSTCLYCVQRLITRCHVRFSSRKRKATTRSSELGAVDPRLETRQPATNSVSISTRLITGFINNV